MAILIKYGRTRLLPVKTNLNRESMVFHENSRRAALEKDIEDYGKLISLNNDKIERLERVLIAHRKGTNQNS